LHRTRGQLDQPVAPLYPFWVCSGLSADRIEPVGQVLQGVQEQVPIAVHRDLDRAVPKMRLDRLRVSTLRDQ
jgi:hypothetical protein